MTAEEIFNGLGISPIIGTNILDWLNLSVDELSIPQRFSKLEHVIKYIRQFPEDTQRFIISKATRGKTVDKLDHLFEYTCLLKERTDHEETIDKLETELSVVGESSELELQKLNTEEVLRKLNEEITLYEK